ncbi:MAG: DUF3459 domain-containing protein, partial [Syntrophales bacterium]|nr:DUF3459 domain-containing protein [Syntrophales bacterium]
YYLDFGRLEQLAKAWREGFIYSWEYSPYRRRRHGSCSRDIAAERWVVFAQNHDQIGNRLGGERLSSLVSFEALKLAAGVTLLSPSMPLLFMGEEYGETAPFLYFVSHGDPGLIEAVRQGRQEEFAAFQWLGEPPDPQGEETFSRSKLNRRLREEGKHKILLEFHRELLNLRRELSSLTDLGRRDREVKGYEVEKVLWVRLIDADGEAVLLCHFGQEPLQLSLPWPPGRWRKRLDSAAAQWRGPGSEAPEVLEDGAPLSFRLSPQSFLVYLQEDAS